MAYIFGVSNKRIMPLSQNALSIHLSPNLGRLVVFTKNWVMLIALMLHTIQRHLVPLGLCDISCYLYLDYPTYTANAI